MRVLLDSLIIWCLILLVHAASVVLMPLPVCLSSCFLDHGETDCCSLHVRVWISLCLYALMIALGSFVSTCLTPRRKLQHSGLLSVVIIFSVVLVSNGAQFPLWEKAAAGAAAFFAMYGGFRLAIAASLTKIMK